MKKLLRHWIAGSQTSLHLAAGIVFCGIWFLGSLIAFSAPESTLPGQLHILGFLGLFLTLLAALTHTIIHGCNRFLKYYQETSHLPVRQLTLVCLFSAALYLIPGAGLMLLCAAALPRLAKMFVSLLVFRRPAAAPDSSAELLPDAGVPAPDLTDLLPAAQTPAWVRVAEQILLFTGSLLLAALFLFVLYRALTRLFYCLTHRAAWDDDIRISLKKRLQDPENGTDTVPGKRRPGRLRRLFFRSTDPGERIRRLYKKTVLSGLSKTAGAGKTPAPWASPEELEMLSGIQDTALHDAYGRARYSTLPCTDEEVRALRGRRQ